MYLVSVENLSRKEKENYTLQNIHFNIVEGKKVAIAGATGSGKTSLLKMMAGLLQTTTGNIFFQQQKVKGPEEKLLTGYDSIAYLSQHFELRNNYYVFELMEMANKLQTFAAEKIYELCQIKHLLQRKTNELSGGEKQRIALALLLTKSPKLLLLDEPFSNLDFIHRKIIKQVIDDVCKQMQITCVLVSHDATDILSWADEIIVLQNGKIIQQGTPTQLYYQPCNEYCAGLLGAYNLLSVSSLSSAFPLTHHKTKKQKIFLRPEQIVIEKATNIFQKDIIESIKFLGSYSIATVSVNQQKIKVQIANQQFSVGDRVIVSVPPHNYWFL